MTINLLRKPANKTFNPSASGTKMQMHHLSSPCGLVRIQPITSWGISRGRSRVAGRGEGGTKVKYPVLHALVRSRADGMSRCAKTEGSQLLIPSGNFGHWPKSAMFNINGYNSGFCPKSANCGPLQIHSKSTQTILQEVSNPFASMWEAFRGVWSDFRHLPKSAKFKTMGYSPGILLKIGQFRTLTKSPEIYPNNPASS